MCVVRASQWCAIEGYLEWESYLANYGCRGRQHARKHASRGWGRERCSHCWYRLDRPRVVYTAGRSSSPPPSNIDSNFSFDRPTPALDMEFPVNTFTVYGVSQNRQLSSGKLKHKLIGFKKLSHGPIVSIKLFHRSIGFRKLTHEPITQNTVS